MTSKKPSYKELSDQLAQSDVRESELVTRLAEVSGQLLAGEERERALRTAHNEASSQHGYWYRRCEFVEVSLQRLVKEVEDFRDNGDFDEYLILALAQADTVLAERRKGLLPNLEDFVRDRRQTQITKWAVRAFGGPNGEYAEEVLTPEQRALRFLEEAVELYQAVVWLASDGNVHNYMSMLDRGRQCLEIMFAKSAGEPGQEIGGTMVTLLCLAEILKLSVAEEEKREFERVLSFPMSHWQARWQTKKDMGL